MNKTTKVITAFLACLLIIAVVYGSYWIYSNVESAQISEPTLSLALTVSGRIVTFTGTLSDSGSVSGKTIYIYHCTSTGTLTGANLTGLVSTTTLTDGSYSTQYTESANGFYYYVTGYEVA